MRCLAKMLTFFVFVSTILSNVLLAEEQIEQHKSQFILVRPNKSYFRQGLFATFNLVLGVLNRHENHYYDKFDGFKIDFGEIGNYYDPSIGPNWWEYYFEPICIGQPTPHSNIRQSTAEENISAWNVRLAASRNEAYALISKYIKIKKPLAERFDAFIKQHFGQSFVIGVHYRGTDKTREAPRIDYEKVLDTILDQANKIARDDYKIFVATDEEQFLEYIKQHFHDKVIEIDAFRSTDYKEIHHSGRNPYLMGEQALMDAYLLSQCNLLIRTSSNLSLASTYFNPALPVILLNKNFRQEYE